MTETAKLTDALALHHVIAALYTEFADRVDSKNWQGYADLYSPTGSLVVAWRDPIPQSEIAAIAEHRLGSWLRTHHMISNVAVRRDDNSVTSKAYVQATHLVSEDAGDAWVLGGRYDSEHVYVDGRWKFETLRLTVVWHRGHNPNVASSSDRENGDKGVRSPR
ncbi:nuclear transport factor 2 family protein [Rhodococcus ruber]|uniref:Nuclear transport factor 2 family protein n=1 Tax=Rhodococcus ruber TaxID=1830 RepID=A0ABT4MEQ9_9NOCA|nr:nuclear transport factor 2 family protein [Rhodococcus ruber]MCZ4519480.1 nuclear transport factor 2 family protein [Rhodococcus ruber]